ncbi:MAG: biotin--[acetyl-CoA-carboxylase] ligase [Saprospiraceae bacterium]
MPHDNYNIIHLKEIDSTNDYAQKLISTNKQVDKTIVLADFQFSGKGQRNNVWVSNRAENLLMSLIIENLKFDVNNFFVISMITAIATSNILKKSGLENIKIKWPNDILINGKKIAGMLIVNNLGSTKINSTIIGLGLNINQTDFENSLNNATSVILEIGGKNNITGFAIDIADEIFEYYYDTDIENIRKEYEKNLFRIGEYSEFSDEKNNIFKGKIIGVKQNGQLIVNINGHLNFLNHHEARLII